MLGMKKGQGATEYLVLLAVVLIVAMVAIALLGFFPGITTDAQIGQSKAYWSGTARPFGVSEHSQSGQNLTLIVMNSDAEQRALTNISVSGSGGNGSYGNTSGNYFSGGERKSIVIPMSGACVSGRPYQYKLNFTFNNADGTIKNQLEIGAKDLIGTCSS